MDNVSLTIEDNEFFTLLGPSGCGKTTLLRLIAGFEYPTEGEIVLFGERIRGLPPQQRPVNTVFQHYALFPHKTIFDNVAFGLKYRNVPKDDIKKKVRPSNILLGRNGTVKLCDFGVAQATIASQAQGAGFVVGKAAYLAPELARVRSQRRIKDAKSRFQEQSQQRSPAADRHQAVDETAHGRALAQVLADAVGDLLTFALREEIDLTIVGPEAPLVDGLADELRERGLSVFGPGADGARL